jgi:predicted TIM-barrel fold metal-dependent hydrolase
VQGVDCHAHVFSATAPAVAGARYRPSYAARLAAWRALWRPAGITHGVLIQPSFFGANNAEMLATIASDPSRLRGVAVVDPDIPEAQLARLDAAGVRGVRLNLRGVTDAATFTAERWSPLFARVHALGWHVEMFHDAGSLPRWVPLFAGSNVTLVLDHFGSPGETADAIDATFATAEALAQGRELWCKLSAPYRLGGGADPVKLAQRWLALAGTARLVWGSDWPWTQFERGMDYQRLREGLERWAGAQAAPAILWDNAARLYGFS